MLLWIYTCAFILCSYCITSSSNFAMLHNVNLNIVNLNTLTLCLSICNRMVPPTQHLLYPLSWGGVWQPTPSTLLDWHRRRGALASFEGPTPTLATLPLCCLQIQRDRGILTLLRLSWLCRTNIVVRNLQTHEPMKMLCGNLSTCARIPFICFIFVFNLRTVAVALVVVYSTDSSSRSIAIEAGWLLSVSRSYRAVGLSASVPHRGLWHGRTWA